MAQRMVDANVQGHGSWNGQPTTNLMIPAWSSKFPTVLYGLSDQERAELPIGANVTVILESGALKEGKGGTKPWDYWWNYVGLGEPSNSAPASQHNHNPGAPAQSGPVAGPSIDARSVSIERQVCLKAAVEFCAVSQPPATVDDVLLTAQAFHEWIQGQEWTPAETDADSDVNSDVLPF